jgi:hypothetical protein
MEEDSAAAVMASPSVHDLIIAHREDRSKFASLRAAFEKKQGRIVEEYYALHAEAALLLVAKSRHERTDGADSGSGRGVIYKTRLYYDPSKTTPEFDDVFRSARRVERTYTVLLRGRMQEILLQGIYTTGAHLLGVLDGALGAENQDSARPERLGEAAASAKKETRQIEQYAHGAAMKSAVAWYLLGIFFGAMASGLCVYFVPGLPLKFEIGSQLTVCLACGGIGAIVSVMVRITNRRNVQVGIDQGRVVTILSGAFRSIIGAVFGAVLFVLVTGGLLPIATPGEHGDVPLFFAGLAFLAGFSERWAQDTIVRTLPGLPEAAEPQLTEPGQGKDG